MVLSQEQLRTDMMAGYYGTIWSKRVNKNALYVQDLEAGYFLGTDNPIRRNLLMVRF